MTARLFSSERFYFAKALCIVSAIVILLIKSEQHYSNPLVIIALLGAGYYLGKITCSVHLKNMSLSITLIVFIVMNIVHSFIDGISFIGQSFIYWISAVGGHEAIRQPMLYVILWAILQPVVTNNYIKVLICFFAVTVTWFAGIWLGKVSGNSISHLYNAAAWFSYTIFLFIGDIGHHLIDQYTLIKKKK
ncbi:MAG: hypothetical protein ACHQIM_10195 [Sphingobacteriales bacterium]